MVLYQTFSPFHTQLGHKGIIGFGVDFVDRDTMRKLQVPHLNQSVEDRVRLVSSNGNTTSLHLKSRIFFDQDRSIELDEWLFRSGDIG